MAEMRLIGRGRAADVFDIGDGRVLRRYRSPRASAEAEARAMQHLRAHGVPVPEVFSADGDDMVMERLDGPTMMESLRSTPWRAASVGRRLAELQSMVHRVPAGGLDLRRIGEGDSVLHFDLHPDNVIVTARGPVIIDWSNVAVGDPLADVMYSWLIMATSSPDGVPVLLRPLVGRIRRSLTDAFVERVPLDDDARRWVIRVAELRLADPNAFEHEKARVREFAAAHGLVD